MPSIVFASFTPTSTITKDSYAAKKTRIFYQYLRLAVPVFGPPSGLTTNSFFDKICVDVSHATSLYRGCAISAYCSLFFFEMHALNRMRSLSGRVPIGHTAVHAAICSLGWQFTPALNLRRGYDLTP